MRSEITRITRSTLKLVFRIPGCNFLSHKLIRKRTDGYYRTLSRGLTFLSQTLWQNFKGNRRDPLAYTGHTDTNIN